MSKIQVSEVEKLKTITRMRLHSFLGLEKGEKVLEQIWGPIGLVLDEMQTKSHKLWRMLDEIDTLSDMFKPEQTNWYMAVMKQVEGRFEIYMSNGYELFPSESCCKCIDIATYYCVDHGFMCAEHKCSEAEVYPPAKSDRKSG